MYGNVAEHLENSGAEATSTRSTDGFQPVHAAHQSDTSLLWRTWRGGGRRSARPTAMPTKHSSSPPSVGMSPVAEHLGSRGAEASSTAHDSRRLPHFGVASGHIAIEEHLVTRGAEVSSTEENGVAQPLTFAARHGLVAVAEHLAGRGPEVSSTTKDGSQALRAALSRGRLDGLRHLTSRILKEGSS